MRTKRIEFDLRGLHLAGTTGDSGPWKKTDTSSGGSPTLLGADGGGLALTLDNTNEVQNLCLSMGDVLPFDIDDLVRVEWWAKVSGITAAVTAVMGLGSARHDTPDSVAANAWFRLQGSASTSAVVVETDDGTTDNDDVATGETLSTSFKRFIVDFADGITTREAPSLSLGGKSNVRFFMSNANGAVRRVAAGTRFDMSAYSAGLQFIAQLQKSAAADTPVLTLGPTIVFEVREPL